MSTIWNYLSVPNPASGAIPFVGLDSFSINIDVLNFYWNKTAAQLSVSTNGDYTGTDSINGYFQHDQYLPQGQIGANPLTISGTSPGFTTSTSRGTGAIPQVNINSDFAGHFSSWIYTGTSPAYTPATSIYSLAKGVSTAGIGGELHLATKQDGGILVDRLVIDNLGNVTIGGNVTVGGSISAPATLVGAFSGSFNATFSSVIANGLYLPAANTLAVSTNSTRALTIDPSGRLLVNLNTTGAGNEPFQVSGAGNISGAVTLGNANVTLSAIPTNGLYLPSTNTLGFSTNSTAQGTIDASGNMTMASMSVTANSIPGSGIYKPNATTLGFAIAGSSEATLTNTGAFATVGSTTSTAFIPSASTIPTNGLYLPAANTVGVATNSGNIVNITSNGLGIGMVPVNVLDITKNQNFSSFISIKNTTVGTASLAGIGTISDTASLQLNAYSSTFTTFGLQKANGVTLFSNNATSFNIGSFTNAPVFVYVNNSQIGQFSSTGLAINGSISTTTMAKVLATGSATVVPASTSTAVAGLTSTFDITSSFVPSTGTFTAPATGFYLVSASVAFTTAAATGTLVTLSIFVNAAVAAATSNILGSATTSQQLSCNISALVQVTAGQTIQVKVAQFSAGSLTLAGTQSNFISIAQIP